ncbi:hypothetical protein [Nitrosomonas sp.]|uniref:hypothetical protein n=1 Tax=Nitrosomonas sp. TaxID=42353 RepID=UPI00374D2C70
MNFGKTLFENSIANSIQEDTYEILITMQKILRLLQLNLFEKRDLMALLRGDPQNRNHSSDIQMSLLWKLTGQQ